MKTRPSLLVLAAFACLPLPARANLRAPVTIPAAPSGALQAGAPNAQALTVLGEDLRFTCGVEACDVEATYRVRAAAPGRFGFAFVLPGDEKVEAKVTPAPQAIVVGPTTEVPVKDEERRRRDEKPVFEAKFEAEIAAGDNAITIRYRQPLGAVERDYGYFKKHGRFLQEFTYLLGPLKAWTLAPDFAMKVQVSIEREPPSWWKRKFGKVRAIGCRDNSGWGYLLAGGRGEQQGDRYVYEHTFRGKDFPDRLTCHVGDNDLLPKPEKK